MVNSSPKRVPSREDSNDFSEEQSLLKKVKFNDSNEIVANSDEVDSGMIEEKSNIDEEPQNGQKRSSCSEGLLADGNDEALPLESSVETFSNPNFKEAKRSLNHLNDRLEAVMNNFITGLSEKVNKLISAVQEASEARRDQLEQLMKEGEELHRKNLETNGQLEKAKELAHQFSLE